MKFFLIFILFACSSLHEQQELVRSISQKWKGRTISELEEQVYFQTLPSKDHESLNGMLTRTYTRRGKFQSKAYCQSLGSCDGMESGDCYHVFSIKNGKIKKYQQKGNCRPDNRTDRVKFVP